MARLRFYALTTLGGLVIVWAADHRGDVSGRPVTLGSGVRFSSVIPMYAVGAWLTWRLPKHPQPVRLLVCGTAIVRSGWPAGRLVNLPWSPVLSALYLEAAAVALLAMALLIGSFPDGFVERRWQRLALRCSWVILIGAPLALLASPVVPVLRRDLAIPNPYAVSWLAWLAQPAAWLALNSGWVLLVGVLVLCARFVAADAAGRAQLRVIFVVVLGLLLYFAGTVASALGAPEDSALVVNPDHARVADGDSASRWRSSTGFCATDSSTWTSSSASPSRTALHSCSSRRPMQSARSLHPQARRCGCP